MKRTSKLFLTTLLILLSMAFALTATQSSWMKFIIAKVSPYPVSFETVHWHSPRHFSLENLKIQHPMVQIAAINSDNRLSVSLWPFALGMESHLQNVRISPSISIAKPYLFDQGKIKVIRTRQDTRLSLAGWESGQLTLQGSLNSHQNNLLEFQIQGTADPGLFINMLPGDFADSFKSKGRVPFKIVYNNERVEVFLDEKPILKTRWKMRQR